MDKSYCRIVNIYDDLVDIKCSYAKRVKFCKNEIYKLKLDYANAQMLDKEYFKKLCPLNREKNNINNTYRNELNDYITTIPVEYYFEEMISEFNINLL